MEDFSQRKDLKNYGAEIRIQTYTHGLLDALDDMKDI